MLTATCSSFGGLATVRFMLGMFEATISPGFVAITGIWWTRQEQASRSAIWISFLGFFGTIGGLITFGIGHISGSLSTWKLIYLILGAFTVVWGVLFIVVVLDNPATARWLTEEEKVVAVQRVVENKTGTKSKTFVKEQVLEALLDPKIQLLALISFVNAVASGGLSFGSIIIKGFGFTSLQTTLMNMPLSFLQAIFTLLGGWAQTKLPNARLIVGSVAMIPPIIGTVLINQLETDDKWGRLVGVWLLAGYPTGFMVLLGLLATNVAGSTKKSTASAMVFVMYCVGQIVGLPSFSFLLYVPYPSTRSIALSLPHPLPPLPEPKLTLALGPQCFKSSQAPSYHGGIIAMLIGFILNIVFNLTLRTLYALENAKRDKALEGKSEAEIEALREESRVQGFENVTDKRNVSVLSDLSILVEKGVRGGRRIGC
jgi:MFS family permease